MTLVTRMVSLANNCGYLLCVPIEEWSAYPVLVRQFRQLYVFSSYISDAGGPRSIERLRLRGMGPGIHRCGTARLRHDWPHGKGYDVVPSSSLRTCVDAIAVLS